MEEISNSDETHVTGSWAKKNIGMLVEFKSSMREKNE